ncbi:MAG: DUF2079 domain-containing protein [Oligoflexus sp.]|nr:DUF2079 domain-containing protein [Oligoflexus sp.]
MSEKVGPMITETDSEDRSFSKWTIIALALLSLTYLSLGYIRSESGLVHAFDTGIYLQILSNLQVGRGWVSSITGEHLFLAHHFQPVVAILVPLYAAFSSPFALLLVSWLALLVSCIFLMKVLPAKGIASKNSSEWIAVALFLYPTLASRVTYSFVPEVMALPALCYLAYLLAKKDRIHRKEWTGLILCLVYVALCKETLWLTSAWTAVVLALAYRKDKEAKVFWVLGLLFLLGFAYLFFQWMPAHSDLSGYYGLSYFHNAWVNGRWGFLGKILGAVLNLFSLQSLGTLLVVVILLPAGLTLFGGYWALAGAIPALLLVMAASNNQIHDLTNHYLIAALPFIAVASAMGLDRLRARFKEPKVRTYLALLAVLIPAAMTALHSSGFVFQTLFATQRMELRLRQAAAELRKEIDPNELILIDGSLQPLFSDLPQVKVILGFQGNPTHVTLEDLKKVRRVITTNDLSDLKDCRSIRAGEGDLTVFDYEGFYQYCDWLKSANFVKKEYLPNRLIDLKIEAQP